MISNLNSLVSNGGATERSPLVEQLVRKADGNRDGQVTSDEFSSFLSSLMQSLDHELSSARASTPAPSDPVALGVEPVALTRAQGAALLRQAFDAVTRSR